MDKASHLAYLKEKYIQLSRQYLDGLQQGRSVSDLKDLADVIRTLITEIEQLENVKDPNRL